MYEELTNILEELPQGEYGSWIVDHENDGSPEHSIQMPYVSYSGIVKKFMCQKTPAFILQALSFCCIIFIWFIGCTVGS